MGTVDYEFVIPINRQDLEEAGEVGHYYVEKHFPLQKLPAHLRDAYLASHDQSSPFVIFSHFDVLFGVLDQLSDLNSDTVAMAWKTLMQLTKMLVTELDSYLKNEDDFDSSGDRHNYLTATKMIVYLLCKFVDAFEVQALQKQNEAAATTGKSKGKRKAAGSNEDFEIETARNSALVLLYQLTQLNIKQLWSPPIVEQDFVNLVANTCYKILENPNMSHVRMKDTRDSVFQIVGVLVKKYGHSLSCTLKLMQLLQLFDHSVLVCAQGVAQLVTVHGCENLVFDLVREIGQADSRDLARDSSAARNYAAFLTELAPKAAAAFIPCISLLTLHLDEESYTMRNGVLSVFTEIVLQVLSGENVEEKNRNLRDQLLDPLADHIQDVHAFVRSRALQMWHKLACHWAIPLGLQHKVLELTSARLKDKSSTVRKHALHLIVALMEGNPFASRLPLEELQEKYSEEKEKLDRLIGEEHSQREPIDPKKYSPTPAELWKAMEPEIETAVREVVDESQDLEDIDEDSDEAVKAALVKGEYKLAIRILLSREETEDETEICAWLRRIMLANDEEEMEEEEEEDDQPAVNGKTGDADGKMSTEDSEEIARQKMLVLFLEDSASFAKTMNDAIPVICQMLGSPQASDVLEAINFFVTAFEFNLLDSMIGIRKMLNLIWSSEADICSAVVAAYKRLYLNFPEGESRHRAMQVVNNLTTLANGASSGELGALEELIAQCVTSGDFPKICIQILWERFSMTLENTTAEESRIALLLIGMVATADVQVVTSNMDLSVRIGLGERGAEDFLLAHLTCKALTKMAASKPNQEAAEPPLRLDSEHPMFANATEILLQGLNRLEDNNYCNFAASAISMMYKLAEHPDSLMGDVIKGLCAKVASSNSLPSGVLKRIFNVVGQVAVQQLIHLDVDVYSELKRRINDKEKLVKTEHRRSKTSRRKSASAIRRSTIAPSEDNEDDDIVGAVADDPEAEFIKEVCETELLSASALLACFIPAILAVSSDPVTYPDSSLRAAATLCLSQFMLISPEFCEKHLQLLFTILEKSAEPEIRSNIVIALGDLNFRYPNSIGPWTPRLYGRLKDPVPSVKKTTLHVLTLLILNDMVKVKGQVSDMALCIVDPDPKISNMAQMFFTELGQKGNALYNVMPDIISTLSDPDSAVPEEDFRVILRSVMGLIQRDKQNESLAEKVILRLGTSKTERQTRDLSFCLSLLAFNDRSLRKLLDNWNCVAGKLHDSYFSEVLNGILTSCKKLAKQETKAILDEIEAKIKDALDVQGEDENSAAGERTQARLNVTKQPATTTKKRRPKKAAKRNSDEESSISSEVSEPDPRPLSRKNPSRPNRSTALRRQNPPAAADSDEDFDTEASRVLPTRSTRKPRAAACSDGSDPGITPALKRKGRKLYDD